MKPLIAIMVAAAFFGLAQTAQTGVPVKTYPTYTRNPYTGANTVTAGAYNPYTGAGVKVGQSTNPYTGTQKRGSMTYNPYTGNTTMRTSANNPWVGASRRTVRRW